MLLIQIIEIYTYIVIGSVVISWINLPRENTARQFLETVTEPLLKPIRDVLPQNAGLDFSPWVLLFLLQFLRRLIS